MTEEILGPDDISAEMLHDLMETAYIESHLEDNEVVVVEGYRFWVSPLAGGKRIRLLAVFGFRTDVILEDRLAFANKINDDLLILRASVPQTNPDSLMFDWTLPVHGGVTRRSIVYAVKLFGDLIGAALREDKNNVIA